MYRKVSYATCLGLLALHPLAADAETFSGGHLVLEEIIVTGDVPVVSTEVGSKTIEKGKNSTVPDVLKTQPDIDIRRRSPVGDTADNLAIRGFSGNRIMLTINGRPVNAAGIAGGHYIDWGTIPLDNIEKIEVIKGGSSVRHGNNALGGVINLITKRPSEKPTFTFYGTYGGGDDLESFQNYRLSHSYRLGAVGYSLAGSFQKAEAFLWNNDFEGKNLAGSFYVDMPKEGQLFLGLQYANAQRGFIRNNRVSPVPWNPNFNRAFNSSHPVAFGETFSPYMGNAFTPGPGANWDKDKYYMDIGYLQPIANGVIEVKLYQNREDRLEKNYSFPGINPAYGPGILVLEREVASDRSYGGSIELEKSYGHHEILAGIEHKALRFGDTTTKYIDLAYNDSAWVSPADLSYKPSSEGLSWGYYIQDTYRINERLLLTGGLRFDTYTNKAINGSTAPDLDDQALTPKLTGTYHFSPQDIITASVYQALRTPGLPETYWWAEGATGGNPVLKPEKNNALELTYQRNFSGSQQFRLASYYYQVDDYILSRFSPNWRGVYNIDKAVLYGASADWRLALTPWLSGNASLTWQNTKKYGDMFDPSGLSDKIDYLPEWKAAAGLEFKLPWQEALFNVGLRYVGERETIYTYSSGWPAQPQFSLVQLDSYITVDASLKIPLGKYTELNCYVENLFDEKYEENFGYPMNGLLLGAAVKVALAWD